MIYHEKLTTKEPKCLPNGSLNPKWLKALDSEEELQDFVRNTEDYKFFNSLPKKPAAFRIQSIA
jgi:hypothetical protein